MIPVRYFYNKCMIRNYFGHEYGDISPENNDIFNGTLNELYDLLNKCWCYDTCAPRMRDSWNKDNKTLGQCSITAFLIQDIFKGEVYGYPLEDGNYHCFNYIDNHIYDLTSEQFKEKLNYSLDYKQSRNNHFSKQEKYDRYLELKKRLDSLV